MRCTLGCILLALLGCSDSSEPATDPYPGRWLLESINAQALPATGQVIGGGQTVVSGRLTIRAPGSGFPRWEYCYRDATDGRLIAAGLDQVRYFPADRDRPAELMIVFPLSAPLDTLRLAGNVLTWEYNIRSSPGGTDLDLLRFRRLADGEAEGPACAL
ncbi:hypothetical protein BH24GEM1_BH24GEM1_20170 [soil metagenome]